MAPHVVDVLKERGFIAQVTDEPGVREYLGAPGRTCYIGFDPTASSLHAGSLVPIMALMHMQRAGHRPLVLVGGGTGLVGDPSMRTEMRQLLTLDTIRENVAALKRQLSRFLDFSEGAALMLNNADWLAPLNYIEFLRDIGVHFSVNRMLSFEAYKVRLETGLSFIEFNYMLLQAYDFLWLSEHHGCRLQMGGSDQWGNIVAGAELIRRKNGGEAFGVTFPLTMTASGQKMGKTAAGAVWLDAERTSPYEYYQYWVNVDDRDVARFLALYTFLPMEEVRRAEGLSGADINAAKSILAYEVTAITHGEEAAREAFDAAGNVFGRRSLPPDLLPASRVPRGAAGEGDAPTTRIPWSRVETGASIVDLLVETGLCASRSAARRLIDQGGAYVGEERVTDAEARLGLAHIEGGSVLLKAGKKKVHRVEVV